MGEKDRISRRGHPFGQRNIVISTPRGAFGAVAGVPFELRSAALKAAALRLHLKPHARATKAFETRSTVYE
jgi:hypothetical protein